jgi:predicted enzyme related to lactoylglutathione lyase
MSAEVSYIEIGTGHCGHTRAFLSELFQWEFHPMGPGGPGWFDTPTMRAGLHGDDPNPGILVFFSVADLDAAVARVRALGGDASDPGPEEPGFGQFSMCRDPQGVRFGLHRR